MKTGKYYEQNQQRIATVTVADWEHALDRCEAHIHWKLKQKILFGAHSATTLGDDPIDHYLALAYEKIIIGDWEWKANHSLLEQMIRIVDSHISKNVEKKKTVKAEALRIIFTDKDIEPLAETENDEESQEREEQFSQLIFSVEEAIKGDPELEKLFSYIREGKDLNEISELMKMDKKSLYRLNERLKYKFKQLK